MQITKWWCHTLNQILFKYDEKRYLSQFVSEMFHTLQKDSTKCALRYEPNSSVTMATYWVPDLPILKAFWPPLPFQQAYRYVSSTLWPLLTFFQAENHWHSEIKWVGTGKEWVAIGTEFFMAIGFFTVELSACQVSMFCTANWPR